VTQNNHTPPEIDLELAWHPELRQQEEHDQTHELRSGDLCPKCKRGVLDYDGLLNLSCPKCGYAVGGCFT
jgi:hypothetical protein